MLSGKISLLPTPRTKDAEGWRMNKARVGTKKEDTLCGVVADATSSPEASPANLFPKPEREKEQMITVTSGRRCYELYEISNRHGSSLKTCVALLLGTTAWFSKQCALTWKAKVTKSNRLLFQLAPSVRRIDATECGLLPTSGAQDWKKRGPASKQRGVGEVVQDNGTKTGVKLRLQPAMTEWMMGFPDGWTELPSVSPDTARNG
jgi:hypothetical protein